MAETQQQKRHKNEKIGTVVSAKMAKTIVVEVGRRVQHRWYRRIDSRKSKFYAHDEEGLAKLGDRVRIVESRPLSKLKRWRLAEVVWKAAQVDLSPDESAESSES
jgi:small subunit ribosomal protein S17